MNRTITLFFLLLATTSWGQVNFLRKKCDSLSAVSKYVFTGTVVAVDPIIDYPFYTYRCKVAAPGLWKCDRQPSFEPSEGVYALKEDSGYVVITFRICYKGYPCGIKKRNATDTNTTYRRIAPGQNYIFFLDSTRTEASEFVLINDVDAILPATTVFLEWAGFNDCPRRVVRTTTRHIKTGFRKKRAVSKSYNDHGKVISKTISVTRIRGNMRIINTTSIQYDSNGKVTRKEKYTHRYDGYPGFKW